MSTIHNIFIAIAACAYLLFSAHSATAGENSAVILTYKNTSSSNFALDAASFENFKNQIINLKKNNYSILPIKQIVDILKSGAELPPRTIGIAFYGTHHSLMAAIPFLSEQVVPFTLFIATDGIDNADPETLDWQQIKDIKNTPNTDIGIMPANAETLAGLKPEEASSQINKAVNKYRDMFEEQPLFFAYPEGEYTEALKYQLKTYNFKAALTQNSGAVYAGTDFFELPSFVIDQSYNDTAQFLLVANALPIYAKDIVPIDTITNEQYPSIGFSLTKPLEDPEKIECFGSNLGKLDTSVISNSRVEVRLKKPFIYRHTNIKCTLPFYNEKSGQTIWRWFGIILINPSAENKISE